MVLSSQYLSMSVNCPLSVHLLICLHLSVCLSITCYLANVKYLRLWQITLQPAIFGPLFEKSEPLFTYSWKRKVPVWGDGGFCAKVKWGYRCCVPWPMVLGHAGTGWGAVQHNSLECGLRPLLSGFRAWLLSSQLSGPKQVPGSLRSSLPSATKQVMVMPTCQSLRCREVSQIRCKTAPGTFLSPQ